MKQNTLIEPDLTPEQRRQFLQDNADFIKDETYYCDLSPDELDKRKTIIADNLFELNKLDEELKAVKKEYKDRMEPFKLENKLAVQEVKTRRAMFKGVRYYIPDNDGVNMNIYNDRGYLVETRRLLPEEKNHGRLFLATGADRR